MVNGFRWLAATLVGATLAAGTGCSLTSAAFTGARMGMNASRDDSNLTIWLDNVQASQNTLKKAVTGYSQWTVDGASTAPKLKFTYDDPASFGRVTMVTVSLYQKFEADYSHQAEFTIIAQNTNDPASQMKPDTVYDLSNPGPGFRVLNLTGQTVGGVQLTPGKDYMLALTIKADRSETAQVHFRAN